MDIRIACQKQEIIIEVLTGKKFRSMHKKFPLNLWVAQTKAYHVNQNPKPDLKPFKDFNFELQKLPT